MKKKDVIGHMTAPKEGNVPFLKRIQLFPLLLCLLAAIIIWLFVVNLTAQNGPELFSAAVGQTVESAVG
mgnify:FL=1